MVTHTIEQEAAAELMTLDELSAFVIHARDVGIPGDYQLVTRDKGFTGRLTKITAVPPKPIKQ